MTLIYDHWNELLAAAWIALGLLIAMVLYFIRWVTDDRVDLRHPYNVIWARIKGWSLRPCGLASGVCWEDAKGDIHYAAGLWVYPTIILVVPPIVLLPVLTITGSAYALREFVRRLYDQS